MDFNVLDSSSVSYHKLEGCIGKILTQFSFFDLIYDCVTQPPEKNEFDHNVKDASSWLEIGNKKGSLSTHKEGSRDYKRCP